jgi:hypothetical protein
MNDDTYRLYRFTPKTEDELRRAIDYVAVKSTELVKKLTGAVYPIPYLTIFAHYPEEYEKLRQIILKLGSEVQANNGVAVKLDNPIKAADQYIPKIRIRQPDPYRYQVGCNDFKVPDYEQFKSMLVNTGRQGYRISQRPDYEMIEIFDPDFDVLAYVVSKDL